MMMKQLFRHTSTLLRTALLFGAILLFATGVKGQTAEQRAAMPDAFETMNPAAIIGDGQYYYIQFYDGNDRSYLSDEGNGNDLRSKDYMPFAKNLQWTLEATGTDGQFYLKSRSGHYVYLDGSNYKGGSINKSALTATLRTNSTSGGGYDISTVSAPNDAMGRQGSSGIAPPWTNITSITHNNHRIAYTRLRIAKLKDNIAHIIYWQEPIYKDGNVVDRNTNTRGGREGFTQHHYLTYSGTGTDNVISDDVSSRRSVLWYYDAWQLPTAAAYHQDGLWTLESAGENGEFYIKKYGDEEYLNYDGNTNSVLGTKSADYGKYTLESPGANRYTRIQNSNRFVADDLTTSMFHWWDGWGANASQTSQEVPTLTYNIGNNVTVSTSNAPVIGDDWRVRYLLYADLTGYSKIVFEGTPGLELRVLLNRDAPDGTDGDWGGAFLDWHCTIGDNGKGELSLSELAFAHLNSIKVYGGSGTISSIKLMKPDFVKTDMANAEDWFKSWDVDGNQTGNATNIAFKVGSTVNASETIAGDGNVYYLTYANLTNSKKIVFEGTPGVQLRVLMNRQGDGGPLVEKTATISNFGKAEVDISDLSYVHIHAIKAGWNSPEGVITAIKVMTPAALTGSNLFLSCANTDGNPVTQAAGNTSSDWYAGFYPVEVPVPNKDEFYQVLVKWGDNMIDHKGHSVTCPTNESDYDLWQLEMVDDYLHFRLKAPNGGYLKPNGTGVTPANDPTGAEIMTNEKFWTDFSLTWFYVNPVDKEIPVNHWVTHRESYLKQYSIAHSDLDLAAQGLATKAQSDWWNFGENANDPTKDTQKVNHFEITHYVKEGNSMVVEFPTVLNKNNDHVYFQRFYNYDEKDYAMDQNNANAQPMNLANLKDHVSLDTRDDGNVQYFLYKNGMVTGQKLIWKDDQGVDIPNGGMARNVLRRFNFTNSDGKRFTVGVDVSRYSDLTYDNPDTPPSGDLEEPSLTMRYVYYMRDAKEMAASLTACPEGGSKWLETKEFHFPMRRIGYELEKKVGYQGEFIGVRHIFSDYWVFDDPSLVAEYNAAVEAGTDVTYLNSHLVSAVNDNNGGKIEVEISDPNGTKIRLGGWNPTIANNHGGNLKFVDNTTDDWGEEAEKDFKGYYFYDKMSDGNKTDYGNSRFVVFRYPVGGVAQATGPENKAYVNVYLNNNGRRYQLAQYTIIFDPLTQTLPWKLRDENATNPVEPDANNPLKFVKDSYRDPKKLVEKGGKPIAKITFDYPANDTYHFPASGQSKQGGWTPTGGTIADCSPIPLTFGNTNYSFMGFECNWGSYSIVNKMTTNYGNHQKAAPANDNTYGYGVADVATNPLLKSLQPDAGLQNGFLYIDASEQPGDICSAPFIGDFCSGDKLMFSGWISGSNKMGGGDNRCPGGVTLTVKGEHNLHDSEGRIIYDENGNPKKETVTLYRFCPGQCYELDDGPQDPDGSGVDGEQWLKNAQGQYVDGNGTVVDEDHRVSNPKYDNNKYNVIWQQFYFEFTVTDKYDRHWIEVNNNCVSSQGGDFMLDNIEVYAVVPEVVPGINTPLCVKKDGTTEMRLLKLSINYNKLKSSRDVNGDGAYEGFAFLDKYKFLNTFRTELRKLSNEQKAALHLSAFDFTTITLDKLADAIEDGEFSAITGDNSAYQTAFNAAILGNKTTWYSHSTDQEKTKKNSSIMYFKWNTDFESMPLYSFDDAVNKNHAVYREVDQDGEKWVVMNGNFPELNWKTNTDYYIINTSQEITTPGHPFTAFNLCSECTKASVFQIEPPYQLLSMESSDVTENLMVCEGKIPTVLANLKGYDVNGNLIPLKDLNFDWWLGDPTIDDDTHEPKLLATLENYHAQVSSKGVRLDEALSALRAYYPGITSLDGIIRHLNKTPNLTVDMIEYLQELVDKGQLILHQKSINIPAQKVSDENPYCYFVACPIHDGDFEMALNHEGRNDVAYFCDEPQGLSLKIGEKAPLLKCGFVSGENGFTSYAYPTDSDPVLSIRLAKKAQFKVVQHGEKTEAPKLPANYADLKYLWLPIRNASTTIEMASDYNVYLASTDDPTGDKSIYSEMKTTGSLPIVGKIVKLEARKENPKGYNRLCVYFTDNFDVREGYTYTLSLPFKEADDANACDGTLLLNLKIVPDYEVWTGAAGNTDWNNDQNWRRADGNLMSSIDEPTSISPLNNNELYRTNDLPSTSPLAEYTTNSSNYRTAKDRLLRKGFAPLYCTHVLIKNNEWGDAPVLYDALDGKGDLTSYPFPNLRDKDGWDGTSGAAEPTKATATAILRFDMQARSFDKWAEVYGGNPDKGRSGDLIAEMYQVNSCDEIAFQAGAELLNAYLLNYNNAWMEYQLDNRRWYLMGSALQGTISGEWYAPKKTAQQKTTYYEPVTFNANDYDRYNPAIYQRSWDKAKAVLYEVESSYSTADNPNDLVDGGSASQGAWGNDNSWNTAGADAYLDRLGYKPMVGKKANVAIKGIWSNTYNDATVDYAKGGFSVMVMNHLKGANNDQSDNVTVVRLPKEDLIYKYWNFDQDVSGTNTDLSAVQSALNRAKNRGRLKTDLLLPASTQKAETGTKYNPVSGNDAHYGYGDRTITRIPTQKGDNALPLTLRPIEETVSVGASNLGFYLVENPFPCGLNMKKFFEVNTGLKKKYWLLTTGTGQNPRQQLVQQAPDGEWVTSDGTTYDFETTEAVVAPGQGFFVQATTAGEATTISFTAAMQAQTRFGKKDKENGTPYTIVVGTRQKTQPKVDQGNPVYVQELNEDGTPKTDDQGNPIYVYELDIDGNPVIDETTGQRKLLQAVEPVFNNDGTPVIEDITDQVIIYSYKQDTAMPEYNLKTRGSDSDLLGLVITAQRDDSETSALVMQRDGASNDFLPEEDTEVFINSDLVNAPTVYTLCGRLATTINSIHDFRSLPIGVESTSDAPCTLTFRGVEMLGDSISFYDAVEQKLTPLESGMSFKVSGQTQNRYYLVRSLNLKDAAEETHLQIFTEGLKAKVIASTAEPITVVRCFDTAGRLICTASPQLPEYSFDLPRAGVYIIEAETEHDRKTMKVVVR
jgi:hypothetical protein